MANTSAIWQQAAHISYHLAAQKEPYKNSQTQRMFETFLVGGGGGQENGPLAEN